MPVLNIGFTHCPFPANFDPYGGCAHRCTYCYANCRINKRFREQFDSATGRGESLKQLRAFCEGERSPRLSWIDWKIPICIGRMTDPFQPREEKEKKTLECLKYLAKTAYPFIITTKATLPATDPEYRAVLRDCNCVFQITMCLPKMDAMERGAPCYARRLDALATLSAIVPRTIVRWSPMFLEYTNEALPELRKAKAAGAFGIIANTAKLKRPVGGCRVLVGNQFMYPVNLVEAHLTKIRATCHAHGLAFMCEEMRRMSDYLTCCIGAPMPGFRPCKCNVPFYWLAKDEFEITPAMNRPGTGEAFQNAWTGRRDFHEMKRHSFAEIMLGHCRNPTTKLQITRG